MIVPLRRGRLRFAVGVLFGGVIAFGGMASGKVKSAAPPLPVEDVASMSQYLRGDLSPDGQWLAYGVMEGSERESAFMTEVGSGRIVPLQPGALRSAVGTAPWSPDGGRLLYIADTGAGMTLRVYDRAGGKARDLGVAAPMRGGWAWLPDGRRIVAQIGREDEAPPTGRGKTQSIYVPAFPDVPAGGPSVRVYQAHMPGMAMARPEDHTEPCGRLQVVASRCDLALIDTENGTVRRLVRGQNFGMNIFVSPDGGSVAYLVFRSRSAAQQKLYDLHIFDFQSGEDRRVGEALPLAMQYGIWSPDGTSIVFPLIRAEVQGPSNRDRSSPSDAALFTRDGDMQLLRDKDIPVLYGAARWRWNADGNLLYVLAGDRSLWALDVRKRAARRFASTSGRQLLSLIGPSESNHLWSPSGDPRIFAMARTAAGADAVLAIDPVKDKASVVLAFNGRASGSIDASDTAGLALFGITEDFRPGTPHLWRAGEARSHALAALNPFLKAAALSRVETLNWHRADGEAVAGHLFLPASYRTGDRLPLIVDVYGGSTGLTRGRNEQIAMEAHLLASRGYAVFYPDAPEQTAGRPAEDLYSAVMPGVDAVIAAGFADPDRLAIIGQSYGSLSTLRIITRTGRFKAAIISAVLHPDLFAYYVEMNDQGEGHARYLEHGQGMMGLSPWEDPERYRANSPIFHFDRITTPVLIGHGNLDPGSATGPGAVFVALKRLGKPVEYRLYGGEGHMINSRDNVVDWWNRRLAFLAENLDIALDDRGRVVMEKDRARAAGTRQ